jgi:hypothetical protein
MADIYRASRLTLIWLGDESVGLKQSFSAAQEARNQFPLVHPASINSSIETLERDYDCNISRIKNYLSHEFDWNPFTSLLQLPWFRRKWVIQEVAMSHKAILLCGRQTLSWEVLEELIIYLDTLEIAFFPDKAWDPVVFATRRNLYCMAQTRCFKEHQTISVLLRSTRGFDCTDPRDHLFALLGLATDTANQIYLKPDYNSLPREVFTRFATWLATTQSSLDFLGIGFEVNPEDNSFPTWVPDFTKPSAEQMVPPDSHFCSSLDTTSQVTDYPGDRAISVAGLMVDTLQILGPETPQEQATVLFDQRETMNRTVELIRWLVECGRIANDLPYGNMTEERYEQFWRTMIWDNGFSPQSAPSQWSAMFFRWFKGMCTLLLENHDDAWWEQLREVEHFGIANEGAFTGRRLGCTVGNRLACVPNKAQPGDKICVFYGGKTPYVVRACGNERYKYVGICYLHGMMHGEALSLTLEQKDFKLV